VILTVAVARVLPVVLRALRSEHDLFLIVSVASGLALAGVGSATFGVPLALAAFVGGLAVTESPEAAEARRRSCRSATSSRSCSSSRSGP
jgi:Kef-type K+ transport system membrane component KefB